MKALYDKVSLATSKLTTTTYSTSFSLGIKFLSRKFHNPIYSIYGFVRLADEIVDSFHNYKKEELLASFEKDTLQAIHDQISLNPILNSFQGVVHEYGIEQELIDSFLHSMKMDLHKQFYNANSYQEYILGSAEVVGLMCLRVFTENNRELYAELKSFAMRLGAAFQKINFLRDLKQDYKELRRAYFPNVNLDQFDITQKLWIEKEIAEDFKVALEGIKKLPSSSRLGVYVAYVYYMRLFSKIRESNPEQVMQMRIRIPNIQKIGLLFNSYLRHQLNLL